MTDRLMISQAIKTALVGIRTAIHAVGGGTPDWPTAFGSLTAVPVAVGIPAELVDA